MDDGIFQWDDAKAIANVERHGVTFEAARAAFRDPFALEWLDESEDYDEDRFALIGMAENRLLFVAYTMRGEVHPNDLGAAGGAVRAKAIS